MSTLQNIDMTELAYETLTLYYETSSLSSSVRMGALVQADLGREQAVHEDD